MHSVAIRTVHEDMNTISKAFIIVVFEKENIQEVIFKTSQVHFSTISPKTLNKYLPK